MTKTHFERFNDAYDTLVGLGATAGSVDVTEALGFTSPNERISLKTATDVDPSGEPGRAIGYLMIDQFVDDLVADRSIYIVNAFCNEAGEVTAMYADRRDTTSVEIPTGLNYGHRLTERTVPNQADGVESALVLVEQALDALSASGRQEPQILRRPVKNKGLPKKM